MGDRFEIPSGIEDRVVHVWEDDEGQPWACAAYDHGPFCRLCQRADEITLTLVSQVGDGLMDVVAAADGELRFRLTEAGDAAAADLIENDPGSRALYDGFVVNEMEKHLDD